MTAIAHRDADSYLAKPDRSHFLFLVFGADQGLVVERSQKLLAGCSIESARSSPVIDFSGDTIASDPLILIDEVHSAGLFDHGPRPIRIELGSKSIIPALERIVQQPPTDRFIVVQGGELKRDAPLRKWFENQPCAASIECYADQARDIQRLLDAEFSAANVVVEPEARNLLIANLGEDRMLTRSEIEKLLLYVRGQKTVTVEDVTDILLDASAINVDALVAGGFSGDLAPMMELESKSSARSIDNSRLSATALRYALSLHRSRADLENGVAFDAALQSFLRLVNGHSRKRETAAQLQKITAERAAAFIAALYNNIRETRQNSFLNDDRLFRLLIAFARSLQNMRNRAG